MSASTNILDLFRLKGGRRWKKVDDRHNKIYIYIYMCVCVCVCKARGQITDKVCIITKKKQVEY
jgi:hypothetical protein